MSRIGLKVIEVPSTVKVEVLEGTVKVTGPKGELTVAYPKYISFKFEENKIHVVRENDEKIQKTNHGTVRANLYNAIVGVSTGFKKELEIRGIGYRANMSGDAVILHIGYSHDITISPVPGSKISCTSATEIVVEGISKQAVGETAARIHDSRPPEPYQGKGIRYKGEYVAQKEGKRAGGK
jgi:large subunit ribosomal protein L6